MEYLSSQSDQFLHKVFESIEENLDNENFSVEDLAESLDLSRSMLHRKLKKLTGKSPCDLITEKRLERALKLLVNDVATTSEIAYRVGFNSPSYFNKVFKKHYQVSPGDARKHPEKFQKIISQHKTRKPLVPKKIRKYIWIALILGNLAFLYLIIGSSRAVPFSERDWILITDIDNLTGDTVFDRSLKIALEVSLQQSLYVNVYPRTRINEVLVRMKLDKTTPVSRNIGIEIANREGIKLIVACNISELANNYTLTSEIIEVKTGQVLRSRSFQANGKDEILKCLDRLGRNLRRDLGESIKSINYNILPLPAATTSSLDALDYLVKGMSAWADEGDLFKATYLFSEAIHKDSGFALAHTYLGSLYYWRNERARGEEHFGKALELLDRLTNKERLLIPARIERFRGNHAESIIKYGAFLKKYPDSPSEWYSLGYSYFQMNRYIEAIDAFKMSNSILKAEDPGAFINIASCYRGLKKSPEAIEYYSKAFELNPALLMVNNLNMEFGFAFAEMGDYDKAANVFAEMLTGDDEHKAGGLRSQAMLLMYLGKFRDAIPVMKESALIYKTLGGGISEYRNHILLAILYNSAGRINEFEQELNLSKKLIETISLSPGWLRYYGKLAARAGKLSEAETIIEEISMKIIQGNRTDESALKQISGEAEFLNGNIQVAEELLMTSVKIHEDAYTLESLAHFYIETGNYDMAIPPYEEIIELKRLGWEAQSYYIEAHYQLARIYEAKGDNEKAKKYYNEFLILWKDADDDIPILQDARSRMKKLSI
jgi:tetratricopeptide (TPR) repeat protein